MHVFRNCTKCAWNLYPDTFKNLQTSLWKPAATVTHNDDIFPWKQQLWGKRAGPVAQFPNSICTNVKLKAEPLFTQKWPQTIRGGGKAQTKVILSWMGAVTEVLAVTHRVPGGQPQSSIAPRAVGSHFLPGTPPKWPVVTPEGLREEVTTGHSTVLETKWSDYALGAH